MIIQCQKCGTQFRIDDHQIGERGAKVRCSKCGTSFVVDKSGAAASVPDLPPLQRPTVAPLGDRDATAVARPSAKVAGPSRPTASAPVDDDLSFVDDADLLGGDDVAELPALPPAARGPVRMDASEAETRVARPSTGLDVEPDNDQYLSGGLSLDGTLVPPAASAPAPLADDGGFTQGVTRAISREELLRQAPDLVAEPASPASPPFDEVKTVPGVSAKRGNKDDVATVLLKGLGTLVVLAVLLFGVLVFVAGGKLDGRLLRLDRQALLGQQPVQPSRDGVRVTAMRSVLYAAAGGVPALVFFGEATATGAAPALDVVASVRDGAGRVLASDRGPLGVALTPPELASLTDSTAAAALYRAKASSGGTAAGRLPFTVVVFRPPRDLGRLSHTIELVPSQGFGPAVPTVTDPEPEPLAKAKKAKGKLKGKLKGKAKAKAAEGATTGGDGT